MKSVLQEKSTHINARLLWRNTFMVCLLQVENCISKTVRSCKISCLPSSPRIFEHLKKWYNCPFLSIVSNILQPRAAFSLLWFVCRLKLKRAWRAFSLRCSRDTEEFPHHWEGKATASIQFSPIQFISSQCVS